jgi:hypothetical protein
VQRWCLWYFHNVRAASTDCAVQGSLTVA